MGSAVAGIPLAIAARRSAPQAGGVTIGLQTWIFTANTNIPRERAIDACIEAMNATGIRECDVCAQLLDPPELAARIPAVARGQALDPAAAAARTAAQQELAAWRAGVSLDHYAAARKTFNAAGIDVYSISLFPAATPDQFNRALDIAQALGARLISSPANLSVVKTFAPLAARRNIIFGVQGRPDMNATDPDIVATPGAYAAAAAVSSNCRISMDAGDATGRGWDMLKFVAEHGESIGMLYLKDRRRDFTTVPFGQGDTPIREIVQLIRDRRLPIRCYIDCDYQSTDRAGDVARSLAFLRSALG